MARAPQTVIIAVGDEVLSGHTQDTNSRLLAQRAFAAGFPVRRIEVVADRLADIAEAIDRALQDPDVTRIAVCGGIGPTPDDRTFEAVGLALGRPLEEHPDAMAHITALVQRMHQAGWLSAPVVSEGNHRSAVVPAGGSVLFNRRGMAPPMAYQVGNDRWLFILPGVPREFSAIVDEELIPRFFNGGSVSLVSEVRYRRVPEAELFGPLQRLGAEFDDVSAGSYPQSESLEVIVRLRGESAGRLAAATARLIELDPRGILADDIVRSDQAESSRSSNHQHSPQPPG